MNKLERRILAGMLFGVLIYAAIGFWTDAQRLAEDLTSFPILVFLGALALTLINYGLRFIKWHYYLRLLGIVVPVGLSLNIFLAGLVMSITPGKLGEVLKSVLLRQARGIPVAKTAPVVFAERLTDLLGLFVIAGVGVITFGFGRVVFVISLVVVIATIVFLQQPRLVNLFLDLLEKLPLAGKLRPKLDEAYGSVQHLLSLKALTWTTLLSVLAWSMEALAFYWILLALDATDPTVYLAFFIYAMATILGAVSFLPGGLGVTEGSMIAVLLAMGLFATTSTAAAATYLIRFSTLWFGVVVGLVAWIVFRRRGTGEGHAPGGEAT
ncbi:MAG: lysylphosphatidylglycerol synthase transmembrane domain-containing protein [Bradymonadaceae bacterium]